MKRCIIVVKNQEVEDDVVTSMSKVTIIQDTKEEPLAEDDVEDAPPIFEESIQVIVDELKEINIGTTEDSLRIGPINNKFLKCY